MGNNRTPERVMKEGFENFFKAKEEFKLAVTLYGIRNDEKKADDLNAQAVKDALGMMNEIHELLGDILNNDI